MFLAERSRTSRVLSLAAAGSMVASATLVAAAPAQAVEIYVRPADNTVTLTGHGFGHGHGMSQWGAYGAAAVGKLSWRSILGFYYPGTTLANLGNPTIRVRLDVIGHTSLSLPASAGLRLGGTLLTGAGITRYRVRSRSVGGLQIDSLSASGWKLVKYSAAPAVFTNPLHGNIVVVLLANGAARAYRGSIIANRATPTSITPVSVLPMESYLRAVVPAEMPSTWHPNALAAQAVAARSYANYNRAHVGAGQTWDTCDTTACQMYSGVPVEKVSASAAVAATAGQTLTYLGRSTFTQFSASNGGWSSVGSVPYLVARVDPYDGAMTNGVNAWTKRITVASIQARWPSIGSYRQLRIISRDGHGQWGGRVLTAAIVGSAGTVNLTGVELRLALGLRSTWFIPINSGPAPVAKPVAKPVAPSWAATRYTAYKGAVLRQGSKGAAVVVLQRALKVKPDGIFGPVTRVALVAFQKKQRIAQNGVVNRPVWDRLEKRDYPLVAYRKLTVRQGSKGAVVVVVQRALRVTADGAFGAKTAAAVKAVQRLARLAQTGVVSGPTWVAIENRMPR